MPLPSRFTSEINLQIPSTSSSLPAYPLAVPQPSSIPINPLARVLSSQLPGRTQGPPPSGPSIQPARFSTQSSSPQAISVSAQEPADYTLTCSGAETTQELDALLLKGTSSLRRGLAEVAYSSFRLHEKSEWASLGFAGEAEYFTSRGYSESTWDSYLLLGERLSFLTLDEMREIPAATARLLATISAKIWPEFAWVEEARILPPREFALLVQERRAQAKGKKFQEPKSLIELAVPLLRKDEFERRMDSLRRREQLPSAAAVLDFALRSAERETARSGVVEHLTQMTDELSRTWDEVGAEIRLADLADPEAASLLAAKTHAQSLLKQIQKSLKELRRGGSAGHGSKSPSLPIEVARDQNSHETGLTQA